jgi:hypothetical protein
MYMREILNLADDIAEDSNLSGIAEVIIASGNKPTELSEIQFEWLKVEIEALATGVNVSFCRIT